MFKNRSNKKELLDADYIPQSDLFRNLHELNLINKYLGGHAVTLNALDKLKLQKGKTYKIIDIGCGGGDTLVSMAKWGRKNGLSLELVGVDLKPDCIAYATQFCAAYPEISLVQNDYVDWFRQNPKVDITVSSLFCHHLSNEQLSQLISLSNESSNMASIINDLHRHALAYYSIAWITYLFSKSYLVKNDAKLSVLRGFSRQEIAQLTKPYLGANISWKWAFRWQIIFLKPLAS